MTKIVFNFGKGDVEVEGTEGVYKEVKLNENEFSTENWWKVKHMPDDKYLFFCLSGGHGGGECEVEITKYEYEMLIKQELTAKDICYKYNIG